MEYWPIVLVAINLIFLVIILFLLSFLRGDIQNHFSGGFNQVHHFFEGSQKTQEKVINQLQSLLNIFLDKKARGHVGEIQLYHLLEMGLGAPGKKTFEKQVKLSNQTQVDALLYFPGALGGCPVDAKFPLENLRKLNQAEITEEEKKRLAQQFKADFKKHVDDISQKYILPGETTEHAVLFLPAEGVFTQIHQDFPESIEYSLRKKVWPVGPSTLMALLTTLQSMVQSLERVESQQEIEEELLKLSKEFSRYVQRWDSFGKQLDQVTRTAKEIQVSSEKITKRFEEISRFSSLL